MKKKFKLIAPSLATLVICLLLMIGSTFAIFTSQAEASIAVTSGKVELTATLEGMKAYSALAVTDEEYAALTGDSAELKAGEATAFGVTSKYKYNSLTATDTPTNKHYGFTTGGTAALENNALTLNKIVPGDRVTINLKLENYSNVKTKYRLKVTAQEAADNTGLLDGLTIKVGGTQLVGVIRVDAWQELAAVTGNTPTTINVPIEVVLPITAGNEYQDLKAKLRLTVEAVQANAKTDDTLDHVNAYLAAQALTEEGPNKTMYDAIVDAKEYIADHTTETFDGTKYLWNIDTDQFYDPSNVVAGFEDRYFKAHTATQLPSANNQTYNIYAVGDWSSVETINLTVGFDAGEATGITLVSYVRNTAEAMANPQEVIIRTNSSFTDLTINAPKDVVHHYGTAGTLNIIAVANASYHENGTVAFVEISKGRIALEQTAKVEQVHISSIKDELEQTTNKFDEIIISIDSNVSTPTFSRDDVTIADQGTLVVALQSSTKDITEETELDYVWLTKQGIFEQIKVSDSAEEITSDAKWANDSVLDDTNTQKAAIEIANNIQRNSTSKEVEATVIVNEVSYNVTLDETTRELVVKDSVAPETVLSDVTVLAATEEAVKESGLDSTKIEAAKEEVLVAPQAKELDETATYACRINNVGFNSFVDAVNALKDNDTIVILNDLTEKSENNSISKNNITIDLNSHTLILGSDTKIVPSGNLTIKNGSLTISSVFINSNTNANSTININSVNLTYNYSGGQLVQMYGRDNIKVNINNSTLIHTLNDENDNSQLVAMTGNDTNCIVTISNTTLNWNQTIFKFSSGCTTSSIIIDDDLFDDIYEIRDIVSSSSKNTNVWITNNSNNTITIAPVNAQLWKDIVTEQPDTYIIDEQGNIEIGSEEALAWFTKQANTSTFSGKTVKLTADLDMYNYDWSPIMCASGGHFAGTFDGNNHTISYLKSKDFASNGYGNGLFFSVTGTVKNLTCNKAKIGWATSGNVAGIVSGYTYGNVTFEKINVINCEIIGFGKVGGIIGMAADPGTTITKIKDCTVKNLIIKADYNVASILGNAQNIVDISGVSIENTTWTPDWGYEYLDVTDGIVLCEEENEHCPGNGTEFSGIYWIYSSKYLFGGYADLYVKYSHVSHDCDTNIPNNENGYYKIAQSELTINASRSENGILYSE